MTETSAKELLARAVLEVRNLKARVAELERTRQADPVVITGLSCRFPMAEDAEAYWRQMASGVDCTSEIPEDRTLLRKLFDPDPDKPDRIYTNRGGFLADPLQFDPAFFGIAASDARAMDPQHALLLEVAWEAVENAGLNMDDLRHARVGVYLGITNVDFALMADTQDPYGAVGIALGCAAGRISHTFGLRGPAVSLDTTCSSSLVAVHLARRALQAGDIDYAIAGGVNLTLHPMPWLVMCRAKALARDGRCKTLDASADGYARGEGCGLVVMRRASDARASGSQVWGTLLASATNHNGGAAGMMVPSSAAQEALLRTALQESGLAASDVGYIEAHGTGTALGDPIEIRALNAVYGEANPYLGTAKVNIGHLEASAGVAGLIRTLLCLRHRQIPPHLHLATPNPRIDWAKSRFRVANGLTEWTGPGRRVAAVSSFGASGTNAHVLVGEPEASAGQEREPPAGPHLFCLSARNPEGLTTFTARLRQTLSASSPRADDVAATLAHGRRAWSLRRAVVASSQEELLAQLGTERPGAAAKAPCTRLAVLFPGQGALYPGAGAGLYQRFGAFRDAFEECAAAAREWGVELVPLLSGAAEDALTSPRASQLLLVATELSTWTLLRSCGVEPFAVAGHSIGEYAAAFAAGVLPLKQVVRLVGKRASLMESVPRGGMVSVLASEGRVRPLLDGTGLELGALNGPEEVVVSGPLEALARLSGTLEREGLRHRNVPVTHAFHSSMMNPILDEFGKFAAGIPYGTPRLMFVSSKHGQRVDAQHPIDGTYWRQQLREPVRFDLVTTALAGREVDALVECGPGTALVGIVSRASDRFRMSAPTLLRGKEPESFLRAVGALYEAGFSVRAPRERGLTVSLPHSPFQRRRLWEFSEFEARIGGLGGSGGARAGRVSADFLEPRPVGDGPGPRFDVVWSLEEHPVLEGHRVLDRPIAPGGAVTGFVGRAVERLQPGLGVLSAHFSGPLHLRRGVEYRLEVSFEPGGAEQGSYVVRVSADGGPARELCTGAYGKPDAAARPASPPHFALEEIRARCAQRLSGDAYYTSMWSENAQSWTHPAFRPIREYRWREGEALAELQGLDESLPPKVAAQVWIEGVSGVGRSVGLGLRGGDSLYLAQEVEGLAAFQAPLEGELPSFAYAVTTESAEGRFSSQVYLLGRDGQVMRGPLGLRFAELNRGAFAALLNDGAGDAARVRSELQALAPEGRAERALAFVREGIASILGTALEEVDPAAPLATLGMDSFALSVLRERLREGTGESFPVSEFFGDASARTVAEGVVRRLSPDGARGPAPAGRGRGRWVVPLLSVARPRARLLCFPGGGGGPSMFNKLAHALRDEGLEVLAVQLPGREERLEEPPVTSLGEVRDALRAALPADEVPFLVLGQSAGCSLAYDVVSHLLAERVEHFVVTAGPPPTELFRIKEGWSSDDKGRFIGRLAELYGDVETARRVVDADAAIVQLLTTISIAPLRMPATIIAGANDWLLQPEQLQGWKPYFAGPTEFCVWPCGHFPPSEATEALAKLVRSCLLGATG